MPFSSASSQVDSISTTVDPRGLLRLKQVLKLIPISAASWWNGVRSGKYPKPVKIGPHTTAWRASDVLALIDSLAADSQQGDRS